MWTCTGERSLQARPAAAGENAPGIRMLVSHRKAFIYTKTAKTASTSVESYFEPFCMPPGTWQFIEHEREELVCDEGIIGYRGDHTAGKRWFNHMSCADIRRQLGVALWERYFKFAVIRDPFDKLLSGYFFQERPRGCRSDIIEGFRRWVRDGGAIVDRHTYTLDGEVCMDYFIRYERLQDGVEEVCRRLDVAYEAGRLRRLKGGFRERSIPLRDFYDRETRDRVAEIYAFELDFFGYRPPA